MEETVPLEVRFKRRGSSSKMNKHAKSGREFERTGGKGKGDPGEEGGVKEIISLS